VKIFIPVVDVGDDHGSGGDGDPLVRVSVDDVDVLVALRGQDHGELAAVSCEDLIENLKMRDWILGNRSSNSFIFLMKT